MLPLDVMQVLHPVSFSKCVSPFSYLCLPLSHSQGKLEVVLEDRNRADQCFYLYELDSSVVCPAIESKLSTGSILLIMCVKTLHDDTEIPSAVA